MEEYGLKLRHILWPYIKVNVLTTVFYLIFYAVFILELELPIKDNLAEFFIPMGMAGLAVLVLLRPKLRQLVYRNDRISTLTYIVCVGFMVWSMIVSASWLVLVTNPLLKISSTAEIAKHSQGRFYKIEHYDIDVVHTTYSYSVQRSGKHNKYLNLNLYFTAPFKAHDDRKLSKYWLVQHYHKQISSHTQDSVIDRTFNTFAEQSEKEFRTADFLFSVNHFERVMHSDERIMALEAIQKTPSSISGKDLVLLKPETEDLQTKEKNVLKYMMISFFSGIGAMLLLLISPGFKRDREHGQRTVLLTFVKDNKLYATSTLIAINILIFIILLFLDVDAVSPIAPDLFRFGGVTFTSIVRGEVWRLITNIFIHAGLMHLVYNIVGLGFSGCFCETQFGRIRFLLLYFLTGTTATIVGVLWDKTSVLVGASGAIFGLVGAILVSAILAKDKIVLRTAGIYAGVSLFLGFFTPGTGNAAHVGGLLSGVILYLLIGRKSKITHHSGKTDQTTQ